MTTIESNEISPLHISESLRTRTGTSGLLSSAGLAHRPFESYLLPTETLLALFEPPAPPVRETATESGSLREADGYTTVVGVTTARVLVISGRERGNRIEQLRLTKLQEIDSWTAEAEPPTLQLATADAEITIQLPSVIEVSELERRTKQARLQARIQQLQQVITAASAMYRTQPARTRGLAGLVDTHRAAAVAAREACTAVPASLGSAVDDLTDAATSLARRLNARAALRTDDGQRYVRGLEPVETLQEAIKRWDQQQQSQSSKTAEDNAEPTRGELIADLQQLVEDLGRAPKGTEIGPNTPHSPHDYYNEFGSLDESLEAAGIDRKQSLLDNLRRLAEDQDEPLKTADVDANGPYSSGMYSITFGSWAEARAAAGLEDSTDEQEPAEDDEEDAISEDDQSTSATETSTGDSSTPDAQSTREEMVELLRSIDTDDQAYPMANDIPADASYSRAAIQSEFGSWGEALEAAGIDRSQRLIEEIRRVAAKLGHPPSTTEMNVHGRVSATTCTNYLGKWSEVKSRLFGSGAGDTKMEQPTEQSMQSPPRDEIIQTLPTVEDIEANERISSPFVARITREWTVSNSKLDDTYTIEDLAETRVPLRVWTKHKKPTGWEIGGWYAFTELLGKYSPTAGQSLSSSRDLEVIELGTKQPTTETLQQLRDGSLPTDATYLTAGETALDPVEQEENETAGSNSGSASDGTKGSDDPLVEGLMDEMDDLL